MPETTPTAEQPRCSCTFGPDGQRNTDGCLLHDLVVCGPLLGGGC